MPPLRNINEHVSENLSPQVYKTIATKTLRCMGKFNLGVFVP